jgi:hypothetical protein
MISRPRTGERILRDIDRRTEHLRTEQDDSLTIEERVEELWGYYRDSRNGDFDDANRQATLEAMNSLANDPEVRDKFLERYRAYVEQEENTEQAYRAYRQAQDRQTAALRQLEKYQLRMAEGRQDLSTLDRRNIAKCRQELLKARGECAGLMRDNTALQARLMFDRIALYHDGIAQEKFAWTPSREALLHRMMDGTMLSRRPILLASDSGTGKTGLVRAFARRVTGRTPFEAGEEARGNINALLGRVRLDPATRADYIEYGPLGQALTGKRDSRQTEAGFGGVFYLDEATGYDMSSLRALVKRLSGMRAGEEIAFASWGGVAERIAPGFRFVMAGNLKSEKHPDREGLTAEVIRDLEMIDVDYLPQSVNDPELFEVLLGQLMDRYKRVKLSAEDIGPVFVEKPPTDIEREGVKYRRVEEYVDGNVKDATVAKQGGALWRMANLMHAIQSSYQGNEHALTEVGKEKQTLLRNTVLDSGRVLVWIAEYRDTARDAGEDIGDFLREKLTAWMESIRKNSREDYALLQKFADHFGFGPLKGDEKPRGARFAVLTPAEIGMLSPRVQRVREERITPVGVIEAGEGVAMVIEGKSVRVYERAPQGTRLGGVYSGPSGDTFVLKGETVREPRKYVLQNEQGEVIAVSPDDFSAGWQAVGGDILSGFAFEALDGVASDARIARVHEATQQALAREAAAQGVDVKLLDFAPPELPAEISPEHINMLYEALGGNDVVEPTIVPSADEFKRMTTDASGKAFSFDSPWVQTMFPKSKRPDWFDQPADQDTIAMYGKAGVDTTQNPPVDIPHPQGYVYLRAMYDELQAKDQEKPAVRFVDTAEKPNFTNGSQMYAHDKLLVKLQELARGNSELEHFLRTRFSHAFSGNTAVASKNTWNTQCKKLSELITADLHSRGLPSHLKAVVSVATFLDAQSLYLRYPNSARTNTYEWTSTPVLGVARRLLAGLSEVGGLSYVSDGGPAWANDSGGARLSVGLVAS